MILIGLVVVVALALWLAWSLSRVSAGSPRDYIELGELTELPVWNPAPWLSPLAWEQVRDIKPNVDAAERLSLLDRMLDEPPERVRAHPDCLHYCTTWIQGDELVTGYLKCRNCGIEVTCAITRTQSTVSAITA